MGGDSLWGRRQVLGGRQSVTGTFGSGCLYHTTTMCLPQKNFAQPQTIYEHTERAEAQTPLELKIETGELIVHNILSLTVLFIAMNNAGTKQKTKDFFNMNIIILISSLLLITGNFPFCDSHNSDDELHDVEVFVNNL